MILFISLDQLLSHSKYSLMKIFHLFKILPFFLGEQSSGFHYRL